MQNQEKSGIVCACATCQLRYITNLHAPSLDTKEDELHSEPQYSKPTRIRDLSGRYSVLDAWCRTTHIMKSSSTNNLEHLLHPVA